MKIAALSLLVSSFGLMAQTNQEIFDQRIAPLLQKNCATCHSAANASAGLSVASFDSVLTGGKHGPALTPGDAKESLLLQYVRGQRTPQMPMGGTLDATTIDSLAKAVDSLKGTATSAVTSKKSDPYLTWLLHKPVAPPLPTVSNAKWVKSPIDSFILSKLEAKGMNPAPPASKRDLLRRVYFDLIGLPPLLRKSPPSRTTRIPTPTRK